MGLFKPKSEKLLEQGRRYYTRYAWGEGSDKGNPENARIAIDYFEKAIKAGCDKALLDLARVYDSAYGGKEGPARALQLRHEAEARGVEGVELLLGRCYLEGSGTPVDYDKAFYYLHKADLAGETYGGLQVYLANCYYHGWGCPKDEAEAVRRLEALKSHRDYYVYEAKANALWAEIRGATPAEPVQHPAPAQQVPQPAPKAAPEPSFIPPQRAARPDTKPAADARSGISDAQLRDMLLSQNTPASRIQLGRLYLRYGDYSYAYALLNPHRTTDPSIEEDTSVAYNGTWTCFNRLQRADAKLKDILALPYADGKEASAALAYLYCFGAPDGSVQRDLRRAFAYALQAVQADQMDRGPIQYPTYGEGADREQLQKARSVERQGLNLWEAARLYEPLAQRGSTEAMRRLGELYATTLADPSHPKAKWREKAREAGDPISLGNKVTMAALVAAGDPEPAGTLSYYYQTKNEKDKHIADLYLRDVYTFAREALYEEQAKAGSPEAMYQLYTIMADIYGDIDSPRSQKGIAWGKKAISLGYARMLFDASSEDDESLFGYNRAWRRKLACQAQAAGIDAAKYVTGLMDLQDQQDREFRAMRAEYQKRQAAQAAGSSMGNGLLSFETYGSGKTEWPEYIYDTQTREAYYVHTPIHDYDDTTWIDRDGGTVSIRRGNVPNQYYDNRGNRYYSI